MDLIKAGLMTWPDVFCWGVLLGIVGVKLADYLIKFLELTIGIGQKRMDIELGKALLAMRKDLEARGICTEEPKSVLK
jgi:hypothetical protein